MDNQINNSLRSLATRLSPTHIDSQQQHNNFFQNSHRPAWNSNFHNGFNTHFLASLIQLIQGLIKEILGQTPNQPEYRSADGTGNNPQQPELGSAQQPVNRLLTPDPSRELNSDGSTDALLPSARAVSNAVTAQDDTTTTNQKGLSDLFWLWGQFLDHDITLIEGHNPNPANIAVPEGDPWFDPEGTGEAVIHFNRSDSTLDSLGQVRQINDITAFIDGSNVYGSDQETADDLRSFDGGKLTVDADNLLPKGENGQYLAGDIRSNENVGLTSMHTLWVREHNRIADELSAQNPGWDDETLYQEARQQVVAEMQAITYNEFLPNLLGEGALPAYDGYDASTDPQMTNAFSTAAYRFGHTMLSPTLLRLDENGQEIAEGNLALRDAFSRPDKVSEAGIDPILRGAASQTAQAVDTMVVDDVRNFLFGAPGAGGFDLASLNIQRGRDHGLPGYNDARAQLGLGRIESFNDPIWREGVGERLAQVYDSPDDVDLWVAGLAENAVGDSLLGETSSTILTQQFENLRNGDRFWYENTYSGQELQELNNLSLADIIRRNTGANEIQDNAMVASNIHEQNADLSGIPADTANQSFGAAQTHRMIAPVTQPTLDADTRQQLQQAVERGFLG